MKYLIISIFAARKCGLKVISKLGIKDKKKSTPIGVLFLFGETEMDRFEELNATVRWTVAADGATEVNLNSFFFWKRKMQTNLAGTSCEFLVLCVNIS